MPLDTLHISGSIMSDYIVHDMSTTASLVSNERYKPGSIFQDNALEFTSPGTYIVPVSFDTRLLADYDPFDGADFSGINDVSINTYVSPQIEALQSRENCRLVDINIPQSANISTVHVQGDLQIIVSPATDANGNGPGSHTLAYDTIYGIHVSGHYKFRDEIMLPNFPAGGTRRPSYLNINASTGIPSGVIYDAYLSYVAAGEVGGQTALHYAEANTVYIPAFERYVYPAVYKNTGGGTSALLNILGTYDEIETYGILPEDLYKSNVLNMYVEDNNFSTNTDRKIQISLSGGELRNPLAYGSAVNQSYPPDHGEQIATWAPGIEVFLHQYRRSGIATSVSYGPFFVTPNDTIIPNGGDQLQGYARYYYLPTEAHLKIIGDLIITIT